MLKFYSKDQVKTANSSESACIFPHVIFIRVIRIIRVIREIRVIRVIRVISSGIPEFRPFGQKGKFSAFGFRFWPPKVKAQYGRNSRKGCSILK